MNTERKVSERMVSEIESDELIDELLKMQQDELDVSYEQT